ncbi:D-alanyl-D-alanine dipeptidase [Mucilaginibacter limnophilus]|uniref:D-alanyl-D-alanine dipeptidase n=1 Tax=Mucilaginibacter limnophilus TaxID=1932778 RepID=A0A3S2Y148_9SPHI|nr:M15 family metallopeptidase [Mucilaginibacter limnophilus]RVT98141.1 D-alanyl-D-alanine dipeptidase [Mucilaginibacter limnophilus]
MKYRCCWILLFVLNLSAIAQPYKYIDSDKVDGAEKYRRQIKQHPDQALLEIKQVIPNIVLDIRYATNNNFTGNKVYNQARAFARKPVAEALRAVQAELKTKGLGLKIFDGYRPYSVTVKFYEIAKDTTFVADPRKGSRHNRGCAIDLTLINLKTGEELQMPTGYDSFSKKAAADYFDLPYIELHNRWLLRTIMEKHGFKIYPSEWWHYDFAGWERFDLLDVPFEAL